MPPSRREELVDAAMRVFSRHGFHASGLDRILEEGGISRMTLYNHFKSKDELILAALRRRDELFRNRMMKFVESRAGDARGRILAVFDFHEQWITGGDFHGCMFINACAEFGDPTSAPRLVALDHKRAVVRYLAGLCRASGSADPEHVAEQLNILLEGLIVTAQVAGAAAGQGAAPGKDGGAPCRLARGMARKILDAEPMR